MNDELISVVVPVYNTGKYLERCVESILNQDYHMLEILLIDDGSSDYFTIQLCDELARRNSNVICYHKSNGGSASARNYGIKRAKGKYIGFIDSDDVIEKYMFSTLYLDIQRNNVRLALGGIATEDNGKIVDRIATIPSGIYEYQEIMHYFMLGSFHSSCTNLYDISLFSDTLFPENEVNEDYMLNYWMFRKLDKVSVNDKILYHYVRREGSNTSSPASLKFLDWIKHTKIVLDDMQSNSALLLEAEFQYLYSNIILANKSLLTLGQCYSNDAEVLYHISTDNLRSNQEMVKRSIFLSGRYRMMAQCMMFSPFLYKWTIIFLLRVKRILRW